MRNNYLLVDGYNIIFAWNELSEMAQTSLDAARMMLQDTLSELQGYTKEIIILVFDGYKVKGNPGTIIKYHNIYVIFTKEAETADQYIEKATGQYAKEGHVRVATSDWLEQIIIMGQGAERISARDLQKEVKEMKKYLRKHYTETVTLNRNSLIDNLSPEIATFMKELRLQETKEEEKQEMSSKQTKQKTEEHTKQAQKPLDLKKLNLMDSRKTFEEKKHEKNAQKTKLPYVVDMKTIKKNNLKKKKKQKKEQKMQ